MSNEKIKRGPVVAVSDRKYSDPIHDQFLPLFERAGLVVDDNDHNVIVYEAGRKVASVWGPAAEGYWFAYWKTTEPVRVESRDDGLRHVIGGALAGASTEVAVEAKQPWWAPPERVDVFAELSYPDEVSR